MGPSRIHLIQQQTIKKNKSLLRQSPNWILSKFKVFTFAVFVTKLLHVMVQLLALCLHVEEDLDLFLSIEGTTVTVGFHWPMIASFKVACATWNHKIQYFLVHVFTACTTVCAAWYVKLKWATHQTWFNAQVHKFKKKIYEPSQNCRCQLGDMQQVPYSQTHKYQVPP